MKKTVLSFNILLYTVVHSQDSISSYRINAKSPKYNHVKVPINISKVDYGFSGVPNFNFTYEFRNNSVMDTRTGEVYDSIINDELYNPNNQPITSFWNNYIELRQFDQTNGVEKILHYTWNEKSKLLQFEKEIPEYGNDQVFIKNIKLLEKKFKTNLLVANNELGSKIEIFKDIAVAEIDGKLILLDYQGNILSNIKYDLIGYYSHPMITVIQKGKYGMLDNTGRKIFPLNYRSIDEVGGGWFKIKEYDRFTIIDINQNNFIDGDFEGVGKFAEGFINIARFKNNCNYFDINAKEISSKNYDVCRDFTDGKASVEFNGKCSYINKIGNLIAPIDNFETCYDFSKGVAKIKINQKFGVINSDGKIIIEPKYSEIKQVKSGNYIVVNNGSNYGVFSTNGQVIIPIRYSDIWEVYYYHLTNESVFVVKEGEKFGVIDSNNNTLLPFDFDYFTDFENVLHKKKLDGTKEHFEVDSILSELAKKKKFSK